MAPMPQTHALRMHRHITHKSTGEVSEETDCAISWGAFYALWRGHWEVENRLHHKRDTVLNPRCISGMLS